MRERCRFNQKIYKRGQWYCFRIVDSFGNRPEIKSATKQEAQMKLLDMTKQVISGMSGSSSYTVTLEQAFEFWLKLKSGSIDESSYQRYQNHSKNFMAFIRERHPQFRYIAEIRTEHINEFMDFRLQEGRATKTVKLERNSLYNLFATLIDHKKMPDFNPAAKAKKLKVIPVQKRRCLSGTSCIRFLSRLRKKREGLIGMRCF